MQSDYTGCLRLMEWGSSFDGGDIGALWRNLSDESEAPEVKCDILFVAFLANFRMYQLFQRHGLSLAVLCICLICAMRTTHG